MSMKNDISFLIGNTMNFYEAQSTLNPNMPVRCLLYLGSLWSKQLVGSKTKIYGRKMIELPAPKFVVFYNGT